MAAYKMHIERMQKELTARYQTLYDLLSGQELSPSERSRYSVRQDIILLKHDSMAIRLAVNDFKGILTEILKVK